MAKRYFWLKLNENFFEREEIQLIENMPNGKDYIIFYMKLLLKSVSTEGELKFRNVIPYTPEMLSSITHTNIDTVKVAIDLFTKLDLMEVWEDGTLFMIEIQNMIGSESDSAKRVRKMREIKKTLQCNGDKLQSNDKMLQSNNDVTKSNVSVTKSNTEIDKDKEIDNINTICETIWKSYPKKVGKAKAIKKIPKIIKKYSFEELQKCIKRYINSVSEDRKKFDRQYMGGDRFFNTGYIDYLDSNYKEEHEQQTNNKTWGVKKFE